jgi:hypothetical protein
LPRDGSGIATASDELLLDSLIARSQDINYAHPDTVGFNTLPRRPLVEAVEAGWASAVAKLLRAGADPTLPGSYIRDGGHITGPPIYALLRTAQCSGYSGERGDGILWAAGRRKALAMIALAIPNSAPAMTAVRGLTGSYDGTRAAQGNELKETRLRIDFVVADGRTTGTISHPGIRTPRSATVTPISEKWYILLFPKSPQAANTDYDYYLGNACGSPASGFFVENGEAGVWSVSPPPRKRDVPPPEADAPEARKAGTSVKASVAMDRLASAYGDWLIKFSNGTSYRLHVSSDTALSILLFSNSDGSMVAEQLRLATDSSGSIQLLPLGYSWTKPRPWVSQRLNGTSWDVGTYTVRLSARSDTLYLDRVSKKEKPLSWKAVRVSP